MTATMTFADWHVSHVLRRQPRANHRPLGQVHSSHRYIPPQPVLSGRKLDIDVSGTRTYRARSTSDIIEEQHKLIHSVYRKAREARSAPSRRHKSTSSTLQDENQGFISVKGSSRPQTSPVYHSSKPLAEPGTQPTRPHSTGARKPAKLANTLEVDPEELETSQCVSDINRQVHEQWEPENHALDEGKFVRGKKEGSSSLDPRTSNQWLVFGGGTRDRCAGVVDAFTAMKDPDEFYKVDGMTGSQVAKQLRRGDKIRVGRNGEVQSHDLKVKKWIKEQQERIQKIDAARKEEQGPPTPVSLCWNDEVQKPDAKVVEATGPKRDKPKPNLCETHPVVFEKLIQDIPPEMAKFQHRPGKGGYRVKSRTKGRVGVDGSESLSSRITSISIDTRDKAEDRKVDRTTTDDVLRDRIRKKSREAGDRRKGEASITTIRESPRELVSELVSEEKDITSRSTSRTDFHSGGGDSRPGSHRPSSRSRMLRSPLEANQVGSLIVNGSAGSPWREGRRSASGSRPPPGKPLHRTGAGTGSSISAHGPKGDAEFIQITQQMPISREGSAMPSTSIAPTQAMNHVINSVSNHNKMEYDINKMESPRHTGNLADDGHDEIMESPRLTTPAPPGTPRSADVKYALKIPTADHDESDTNSADGEDGSWGKRHSPPDDVINQIASQLVAGVPGNQSRVSESVDTNDMDSAPTVADFLSYEADRKSVSEAEADSVRQGIKSEFQSRGS